MVPPDIDEFALAGLEKAPCRLVAPARVRSSPVAFQCRLSDLVQLRSAAGQPVDSWLVLGEVVGVHIDEELIADGVYHTARARPILRAGGAGDYFEIAPEAADGTAFVMPRPR